MTPYQTRCPKCQGRPHLIIGALLHRGDTKRDYLVCWPCSIARFADGGQWASCQEMKTPKDGEWTVHSRTHWTRLVGGDELHYWPTTGTVRFRDVTHRNVYDVDDFIRGQS